MISQFLEKKHAVVGLARDENGARRIRALGGDPVIALPVQSGGARAEPVANSEAIEGQWDIVSFRGYAPRRLQGTDRAAVADFRRNSVALRIECNSSGVAGEVRNGRFVSRPGDRIQTLVGCGPVREARDAALFRGAGCDLVDLRSDGAAAPAMMRFFSERRRRIHA